MKIKKNDTIKILTGKDAGKTGKVLRAYPTENKIIAEGLNLIKKHKRPRREGEKGQRVELPRKFSVSNVMLVCPKCGKTTRVGYKKEGEKKVRICKKCEGEI
jgi:large subunit ribosomal protein L24